MHKNSPFWYKKYKNFLAPSQTKHPSALDLCCPFQMDWTPSRRKILDLCLVRSSRFLALHRRSV